MLDEIMNAEDSMLDDAADEVIDASYEILSDDGSDIDVIGDISDEDVEEFDYDPDEEDIGEDDEVHYNDCNDEYIEYERIDYVDEDEYDEEDDEDDDYFEDEEDYNDEDLIY